MLEHAQPLPDLGFLAHEPLLNRERASATLAAEGLDGLVVGEAANLYYCTNQWPLISRMSLGGLCFAVVPRDSRAPVTLITPRFTYYYTMADAGLPQGVEAAVYAQSMENPALAGYFRLDENASVSDREAARRTRTALAQPFHRDARSALQAVLRSAGLEHGCIGVDAPAVAAELAVSTPGASLRSAADTLRRIRFVKSPAEIRLMRIAARENAEAGLQAVRSLRDTPTLRGLRSAFFARVAARGGTGVFMVIDGASSALYDEPLREGQWALIDCVSSFGNYHGDYGRTVCIGEPEPTMRRVTGALANAWDEIHASLRPGVRFSAIREQGAAVLTKQGFDYSVGFNPHSVGLWHSDQPRFDAAWSAVDHVLEAGMVLSIDCPLTHSGLGGSAHLEDLVLITSDGAQFLNDPGDRVIMA